MKIFGDKGNTKKIAKITKIIVYVSLAIILYAISPGVENQSAARFLMIAEIVLLALALRNVLSLAKEPMLKLAKKAIELIKKALAPIIAKIRERYSRKKNFAKGSDEKKLIFNFGILDKIKNRFKSRIKLSLKNASSNMEKIRLLYIKYILLLSEKHHKIKHSHTPKELKTDLAGSNRIENDILFDIYEEVRYNDAERVAISDEVIGLCENALDKR
jgi:hypothetical protein